ncbi:MAG: hypothetical protein ACI9WU_000426 [Myxococcota bacterium]
MLSPADRPAQWRATGGFDAESVGLAWATAAPDEDGVVDTAHEGLANTGHEFGASLTPQERGSLLAFLVTL